MDTEAAGTHIVEVQVAPDESRSGTGDVHVVRRGPRSFVQRAFARSPLRLLNPSNHGHGAWLFSSTYGGGLVGGDVLSLHMRVGPGATALLQTQSSTKVYRSNRGVASSMHAVVEESGLLVVLPDPVVCFAGSTYAQTQTVDLSGSGGLVLLDWMTCGRRASGERWEFDRYSSRITIHRDEELRLFDGLLLEAADGALSERLGRFACLGTIVLTGFALREHVERIRVEAGDLTVTGRADILMAVAPLGLDGCLIRLGGVSVEEIGLAVRKYLRFLPALLGDDPWARKW